MPVRWKGLLQLLLRDSMARHLAGIALCLATLAATATASADCAADIQAVKNTRAAELAALDREQKQRHEVANRVFATNLKSELAAIDRQHLAQMEEIQAEMHALDGDQFKKFYTAPPLRMKRTGVASATLRKKHRVTEYWRKWLFNERGEIDEDISTRKKLLMDVYSQHIKRMKRRRCGAKSPSTPSAGGGIRG